MSSKAFSRFVVIALAFDTVTGKSSKRDVKGFVSMGAATNFALTKNHVKGSSIVGDAKIEKVITSYAVEERPV